MYVLICSTFEYTLLQVLAEMKQKIPDAHVFPKLSTDNSLLMFLRLVNFDVKNAVDEYKRVLVCDVSE